MSQETKLSQASFGKELTVHTKTRAFVTWVMSTLARFPREHRHTLAERTFEQAGNVLDSLIVARHCETATQRVIALRRVDVALDQLRQYFHIAWELKWLSDNQFRHVSELTEELGRLSGGWRKRTVARIAAENSDA